MDTSFVAQTSTAPLGISFASGKGVFLEDMTGNTYLDFTAGIAVNNLGFSHPKVVEAITKQVGISSHAMVFGEYKELPQQLLAEKVVSFLPKHLNKVYFTTSGSEAIEAAIKLARKVTGRKQIFAFKGAYHGSTHGALSLMGDQQLKEPFYPLLPNVAHLRFNHIDDLQNITTETAGVFVEIIQSASGATVADTAWLEALSNRCKKVGALLVIDEIQTGIGRTGQWFGITNKTIQPDVICVAKALGAGMPIGAFVASEKHMATLANAPALGHINTFGGNGVVCAAALAGLKVLEQDASIIEGVAQKEQLIRKLLQHKKVEKITGEGLLLAVHLTNGNAHRLVNLALAEGLITLGFLFNEKAVRISPALTITTQEIKKACAMLQQALDKL